MPRVSCVGNSEFPPTVGQIRPQVAGGDADHRRAESSRDADIQQRRSLRPAEVLVLEVLRHDSRTDRTEEFSSVAKRYDELGQRRAISLEGRKLEVRRFGESFGVVAEVLQAYGKIPKSYGSGSRERRQRSLGTVTLEARRQTVDAVDQGGRVEDQLGPAAEQVGGVPVGRGFDAGGSLEHESGVSSEARLGLRRTRADGQPKSYDGGPQSHRRSVARNSRNPSGSSAARSMRATPRSMSSMLFAIEMRRKFCPSEPMRQNEARSIVATPYR